MKYLRLDVLLAIDDDINIDTDEVIDLLLNKLQYEFPQVEACISTKGEQSEEDFLKDTK